MFHYLFEKVNNFNERIFEKYGRFLSKYYVYVIIGAFVLNLVLGIGVLRLKMITDADLLFMPVESVARHDEQKLKTIFNTSFELSNNFFIHQLLDLGSWAEINFRPCSLDDNILQDKYLLEIAQINEFLLNKTYVIENGSRIGFQEICAIRNGQCLIDGEDLLNKEFYVDWLRRAMNKKTEKEKEQLELYGKLEDEDTKSSVNEFRFYMKFSLLSASLTDLSYNLGKDFRIKTYNQSKNGTVPAYARVFKLRYNLKTKYKDSEEIVKKWELEFLKNINLLTNRFSKNGEMCSCKYGETKNQQNSETILNELKMSYATSQSLDLEMASNIALDMKLIVGTFILIMIFACLLMSLNTTCITSPGFLLPLAGISSALFGIISSFGLMSYLGYEGCNLIMVVPFLVIGIGIDDMFIIYSSFTHVLNKNKDIELPELIATTFSKSGVSITITSLTDFVAFLIGITTGFKSVQIFCVYAGFAIAFCYFYQLTLFGGFICIHAIRIKKKHNSILFCFKQKNLNCFFGTKEEKNLETTDEREMEVLNENGIKKENQIDLQHKKKKGRKSNPIKFLFKKWKGLFKFLISTKRGKLIVGIIYLFYISFSLYSAFSIKEGIELSDLVAEDSYYSKYIKENWELTDLNPIVMFVIYEPLDYDSTQVRMDIKNFINDALKIDGINKNFKLSWLENFMSEKLNYKNDLSSLMMKLRAFTPFMNDIIIKSKEQGTNKTETGYLYEFYQKNLFDTNKNKKFKYEIQTSRFYLQYGKLSFSSKDAQPMHLLRKLCKESNLPILPYSITFKYYEQFEQTFPNILQSFLIAIETMYLISLLFIPDIISAICIIFSMLSIMAGMIGWMHFWGLTLSSITMIELIMSVGFCIDFSAHITYAFIADAGQGSRSHRAYKSCKRVGKPIFNSAISTIIGISLLGFSKSYIFMSFFKTLFILMCLGLLNSLLFLPVLLSIIGPHWPRHKAHTNKIIENHLNNNTEGIKINNECAPKAQIEELLN